jgi:trans-2-enoyl-CoA reductase
VNYIFLSLFRVSCGAYPLTRATQTAQVANDIPASYAATLSVDASTAYRLLRDYGLTKGDWLIQSNASGPLGVAVVQMARELGIRTINVIDSASPDQEKALRLLTRLGGDLNVTDLYVHSSGFNALMAGQKIKLAVNSANGDVVTNMARALAPGGVFLTIDGTDADPKGYQFPAEKTPTLKTFKIADWYAQCTAPQKSAMWADIAAAVRENRLTMFYAEHDFDDFAHALGEAGRAHALRKVVLRMDHPDRLAEHDALPAEAYEVFETTVV